MNLSDQFGVVGQQLFNCHAFVKLRPFILRPTLCDAFDHVWVGIFAEAHNLPWPIKYRLGKRQVFAHGFANVLQANSIGPGLAHPLIDSRVNSALFFAGTKHLGHARFAFGNACNPVMSAAQVCVHTLARSGILKGKSFTLHWENITPFREIYPELDPKGQLYVIDDRILTSSGGSAATDLFLRLIHDRFGSHLSQAVLNMCVYTLHRSGAEAQQSSRSATLGIGNKNLVTIIKYFEDNIDEQFNLDDIAAQAGISRRQIERLFTKHLGLSPKKYFQQLRLGRARALLAETDLPMAEVAAACGFDSATYFAKRFRDMFGVTPHRFSAGRSYTPQ